jgi:hypothetical protein
MLHRDNPQRPRQLSNLTSDIRTFMLNRNKAGTNAPAPEKHQQLDTQMLFSDLENLLKSMDQTDARVQRAQGKLHELKTAVLLTADKN